MKEMLVRHPRDRAAALRIVQAVHPMARLAGEEFLIEHLVIGRLEEDENGRLCATFEATQVLEG